VPSTVIRRVAYRPGQAVLDVEFMTGRVYRYLAVPEAVGRAMEGARIKGAAFNRTIRDRYAFERLPAWPDEPSVPA
jgi:hypothetical protein